MTILSSRKDSLRVVELDRYPLKLREFEEEVLKWRVKDGSKGKNSSVEESLESLEELGSSNCAMHEENMYLSGTEERTKWTTLICHLDGLPWQVF